MILLFYNLGRPVVFINISQESVTEKCIQGKLEDQSQEQQEDIDNASYHRGLATYWDNPIKKN